MLREVPAVVGGALLGVVGDECALGGFYFSDECHEFGVGVSFDVEFDGEHFGELVDVVGSDVALVGSGVDGDAVASGVDAGLCGLGDAGDAEFALVAEEGDLVEVYAEFGHGFCVWSESCGVGTTVAVKYAHRWGGIAIFSLWVWVA